MIEFGSWKEGKEEGGDEKTSYWEKFGFSFYFYLTSRGQNISILISSKFQFFWLDQRDNPLEIKVGSLWILKNETI